MKIHEYQGKEILRQFGVPVPRGIPAFTVQEAVEAAQKLGGPVWVVKAQIHAGGRGKGGGVKVAKTIDDVKARATDILGMQLVTHQTGPEGQKVRRLYIEDGADIQKEYYLSAVTDRATQKVAFIASSEGGMDIEEVAHSTPEKIITVFVDPLVGFTQANGEELGKGIGMPADSMAQFIDICQKLYETHKLITYPRSDSRYLPEEHFAGRHSVMNAISVHAPDLLPQPAVNPDTHNRCWDDKKVDAHHAIIPTARASNVNLTYNEAKVYNLIARQYLMQFCPDAVFRKCVIELEIAKGKFVAKARFLAEAGWRTLLGNKERDEENDGTPLPVVAKDDELLCEKGEVVERQTQPPRHFTDATLLSAMTGIARFVQDKDLKKILRATDGLGTEATRAGIIELLFKRGFLEKKGRYIHSTEPGRALIHSLPELAARPDMTAHWESVLTQISEKQCRYQDFMQPLVGTLYQLIDQARSTPVKRFRGMVAPGAGAKKPFKKKKSAA